MRRRSASAVALAAFVVSGMTLSALPAHAGLALTPLRTVGFKGHAYLYGWGVAVEPPAFGGDVIVGDYWNFSAKAFNLDGTKKAGFVGLKGVVHQAPYGIAVDPRDGSFYVGDVDAGAKVDKYDKNGNFLFAFGSKGTGPSKFTYPAWVAVASDGRVFVADSRQDNYEIHAADGSFLFECGRSGFSAGQFKTPRGLALDANDNLYVVDASNKRVQVFDASNAGACPTFKYSWTIGTHGESGNFHGDFRGIAVDKANGWVYVVDGVSQYVHKYTLSGAYLLSFGGFGTTDGKFIDGGRGVGVDAQGNVWVGDMPNFRVQKFSSSGTFLAAYPDPPQPPPLGGFAAPTDVGLDANGNLFITDTHNWRIQKLSNTGSPLASWGVRGSGKYAYNYPKGIDVDRNDGSVVVADSDNGFLKKYSNSGNWLWTSSGGNAPPSGVVGGVKSVGLDIAPDGTIYASDFRDVVVEVIDGSTGAFECQFGSNGFNNGQFVQPRGVMVDPVDGSIWVADRARGIVQHFAAPVAVAGQTTCQTSFLGKLGALGTGDGFLSQAEGVAADQNYVYVADAGDSQIKVWTKSGLWVGAFGAPGRALGQMLGPHGIEIGPDGNLYVDEQNGERVSVWQISIT